MARKGADDFTDVELEIMHILWEKGRCSSDEVRQSMPGSEKRKDSTVRTILSIMEKKGYIRHEVEGRTFIYCPTVKQEAAQKRTVKRMLEKVFDGSPKMLLQCLFDSAEIDDAAISEIRELLEKNKE